MRPLSTLELLNVWELGLTQSPSQRALALLAAACPEVSPETLAELSIGQRDARLLTLREWAFGPHLVSLATCPACGERLELAFDVADIRVTSAVEPAETLRLAIADYELQFRLPNSLDLAAVIVDNEDVSTIHQRLLERCLISTQHKGEMISVGELPENVVVALVQGMAQADPQADMQLVLTCPVCEQSWQAIFDIASFFWREIETWVHRLLRDVHCLASAYGWSETDILALSPWRRQYYLALVQS